MLCSLTVQFIRRTRLLQLPACMIAVLLQRTPAVRLLAVAESVWVNSAPAQVLLASVVTAALLGTVDTLAGATAVSPASETSASAQVGSSFTATFAVTGLPKSVGSYSISGLPFGLSVPGATFFSSTNTYSLNAPFGTIAGTPATAGNFSLTITGWALANNAGVNRSYSYSIVVSPPPNTVPVITLQPASRTVAAGSSLTFAVAASGTPAPTFQWQKNGINIVGAVGNAYTIFSATSSDEGDYTVLVTNSSGSTASNIASLTVIIPPGGAVISITVE